MHQFKINGKMAFEGDVWQWHQDYGTWKNDDLMPDARAMNVANFLQDVECLSDDCLTWPCAVDLPWRNGMPGSALETSDDVIALAR